jgi:hypothetical protein
MKKLMLISILVSTVLFLNAKDGWDYRNYFRTDSTHVFSWDGGLSQWNLSTSQIFHYNADGNLNSVTEKLVSTGEYISKSENLYNEKGLLSGQNYYSWIGEWIPTGRNQIIYDEMDRISEILIQGYSSGEWINNRWQKNYKYDQDGHLVEFQMVYWYNNMWSPPTTDYSTYDDQGRLIKREALYSTGNTDYQVIFNYDSNGLRSEMFAQYPSGTNWFNWWLISYQYDDCGKQQSQIQYIGSLTEWIPSTKTITYNSFKTSQFPGNKVPICHNGNTIYVSKNAVNAHLAHGDCIGECTVEKKNSGQENKNEEKKQKPLFTVYPNPAWDKFTIKIDQDESCEPKRVELTDFYGKLLKNFSIKDNSDVTIYRNNLPKGTYFIRVVGRISYSKILILN